MLNQKPCTGFCACVVAVLGEATCLCAKDCNK